LHSARRWHAAGRGCLFCMVVEEEVRAADRLVAETPRFVAFVPAAAHWPHEVHIYPRRHVPDLPALDGGELDELMGLYVDVLRRFDRLFDMALPYVAAWHQAPVRVDRELSHLWLQLFSPRRAPEKLKHLAASESGVGAFINDVEPEDAARRLRDAGQARSSGSRSFGSRSAAAVDSSSSRPRRS
jgi:UDPglucose--hexose-1-phosphate uridylyltransferase